MELGLAGKTVVVTGGLKGIGKAIVMRLAREGAVPVILNRSDITDEYIKELEEYTSEYEFYQIDLNDTDGIAPIIDDIAARRNDIYGIVNNAGANDNKSLEETSWREFEASLHGNLTHYYEVVHVALPYLKRSRGAVVNISSKTALTGQGRTSAYAAAKGAILGLTREWAAALAEDGVRVNAIVVSEAWTPLYAEWIKSFGDENEQVRRRAEIERKIPLGHRMTEPDEIADAAAFLLSDVSAHTTGQWVFVDGGYVHLDRALT